MKDSRLLDRGSDWSEWAITVAGIGIAGYSCADALMQLGARVTVVDPSAGARETAMAIGAAQALDPGPGLLELLIEVTAGGPHLSVDAIGDSLTCRTSIESLRPRGRHVQVGLLPAGTAMEPVPMHRVVSRELEILGSHGLAAHDYPELLALVASGRLRPDLLVGRVISLDAVPAAFALIGTPDQPPGMTLIHPN